jgi:penicillin G amidase
MRKSVVSLLLVLLAVSAAGTAAAAPPTARLDLPGLDAAATVIRDSRGIPHVFAATAHDLFFLQGWVHAEDRLFQMDLSRRQASGTLAEVLGPAALASDVELRTLGLRRAAERSLAAVSAAARADLDAYAAGVNAWVAAHPLPAEYAVLELTAFAPWTPADSLVIAKLIAFGLSFDLDVEATVTLATYQGTGQAAGFDGTALYFQDLFRSAPFDPASTVPDALGGAAAGAASRVSTAGAARGAAGLSPAGLALAEGYLERVRRVPLLRAAVSPRERVEGSNEWAVSGALTADGRPLMANDPHLSLDVPATFHQVHLRSLAAGMDVIGSGFPGTPYVILGQNRRITWGATTNPMDVTDTFQEQIVVDPASPSGLATVYQGANEPVIPIPETFRFNVLDGAPDTLVTAGDAEGVPPVTLIVPRRNQGPIVALDVAAGTALSVQYTGFSATREIDAFRLWNQARNLAEFETGLRFFDFGSQNWAYADVDGNIAYFASAEMPLREDLAAATVDGLPPFFIRDGTGGNEWLPAGPDRPEHHAIPYRVLPMDEMPHAVNPPAGWFVNANNDPAGTTLDNDPLNQLSPTSGIYYLNPGYAQGTRAGRITDRIRALAARGGVTAEDMMALQADVVMLDAQVLVPYILDAVHNLGALEPDLAEPVALLADWDFSAPTGIEQGYDAADVDGMRLPPSQEEIDASVAATIYSLWRSRMIANTLDATIAPFALPRPGSDRSIIALRHLLDSFDDNRGVGASGLDFFADGTGATPEQRRDEVILASLEQALDLLAGPEFAAAFGGSTDVGDYRWGLLHRIVFDHPLGPPFSIPPAGGGFVPNLPPGLPGVPVDGGFGVVDASSHSARADSVNDFMFGSGPVRRYVGSPGPQPGSILGWTAMPGGTSGVLGHPWYFNLLPRWLTNDAYPVLHGFVDVQQDAYLRTLFRPAPGS